MAADQWDEIHEFGSPAEFARFEAWITTKVSEGELCEISVEQAYGDSSMFDERWFRSRSGAVWRLVAPEYPFQGVFEVVK